MVDILWRDHSAGKARWNRAAVDGNAAADGRTWPDLQVTRFEWDDGKAKINLARHGVAFEDAALVWDDRLHMIQFDSHEAGEERWHAIGQARGVAILVVWHTYPDPNDETRVRIIGARKAVRRERLAYEQGP